MRHKKDYIWSLNRGLYGPFQNKYVAELFEHLKNRVIESDEIPERPDAQISWICAAVHDEVNGKFKNKLVKQILKCIRNAPLKREDGCYDGIRNKSQSHK